MTAAASSASPGSVFDRLGGPGPQARTADHEGLAPLSATLEVARALLVVVALLAISLVLELLLVSPLQARAAQQREYDKLRHELAAGTAPVAPADLKKKGVPIGYLEIPAIGVRQVVLEGTDGATLFNGPGHRRDTPMPGQAGTSVVMGRQAAFGGPFADIYKLPEHATVQVTTGAGVFAYRVIDVRHSGDPAPLELRSGAGRIVLVTASGSPFAPSGLTLVDADLITPGLGGGRPLFTARTLPDSEKLMSFDLGTLWRLAMWLQALVVVVLGGVFAWFRWHRAKTWLVFLPALLLVGLMAAGEAARLMPNLL